MVIRVPLSRISNYFLFSFFFNWLGGGSLISQFGNLLHLRSSLFHDFVGSPSSSLFYSLYLLSQLENKYVYICTHICI